MSNKPGLIYVLESDSLPHNICKIGQTKNWIGENSSGTSHRKVVLQTSLPHEIYPVAFFVVSDMDASEGFLQSVFSIYNLQYGGGTEWFFIPQDYLKLIINHSDINCVGELSNVESDKKAEWLKARISECQTNKNFELLKNEINKLRDRKLLYLKSGDVFCQGIFEDGKFIVLKGSTIASEAIDLGKYHKSSEIQKDNLLKINNTWKRVKKLCKKNKIGQFVLDEDLDISNTDSDTSSMWTQGIVGSPVSWVEKWKFADFPLKKLKEENKIDYPERGKVDKKYIWLK